MNYALRFSCKTAVLLLFCFLSGPETSGLSFRVASYNVENLFDCKKDGNEYKGYIPESQYNWTQKAAGVKYANIARVIADIRPAIIGLQEVESRRALNRLRKRLKSLECAYPYSRIADEAPTTVRCALLSKFPIKNWQSIRLGKPLRDILQVTVDVRGFPLVIFINHWKSQKNPESLRVRSARVLRKKLNKLSGATDAIVLGDFNSSHNAYESISERTEMNDTEGITGINHVLNTIVGGELVTRRFLQRSESNKYLYNLWLELSESRRWSHNFFGTKKSLDHMLITSAMLDGKGIDYVEDSFRRFSPDYLFEDNAVFRWQRADDGDGKHLGRGYSDHLPIYATFTAESPEQEKKEQKHHQKGKNEHSLTPIVRLYKVEAGRVDYRLDDCAVIYKQDDSAVIKRTNDRAIFVYKAAEALKRGHVYDLGVKKLYDYHGLREIKALGDYRKEGRISDVAQYLLDYENQDLSKARYQNEVVDELRGKYQKGALYYGDNYRIDLYFEDGLTRPDNGSRIILNRVRVGYYQEAELKIEREDQWQPVQNSASEK